MPRSKPRTSYWMWTREQRGLDSVRPRQKESTPWAEGYDQLADMPGTGLVCLAERDADTVEMMRRAHELRARSTAWYAPNTTVSCRVVKAPSCTE
jgi:hypothetical protein